MVVAPLRPYMENEAILRLNTELSDLPNEERQEICRAVAELGHTGIMLTGENSD